MVVDQSTLVNILWAVYVFEITLNAPQNPVEKCLLLPMSDLISGLSDENHLVQNAALFALGQYSEYLQVIHLVLNLLLS